MKIEDTKLAASQPLPPVTEKLISAAKKRMDSVVVGSKARHLLKEQFELGDELGRGDYGTTFVCVDKKTGKEYACKSISKRRLLMNEMRKEIEIMSHLSSSSSRNVISFRGAYEDAAAVYVVMELCRGGELLDRILEKGGPFSEKKAAELTRTIVGAVETCHSLGVMHRDLKPENFLFVDEGDDSDIKMIDFGLSVFFKPGELFDDAVGSPDYMAPEVIDGRYGPEADVWSAGVILYILLCGMPPFWGESDEEVFEGVLHGEIDFTSGPWPSVSDSAKDLVKRMLERNPKRRITAQQVLCHPWVQVAPGCKSLESAVQSPLSGLKVN